MRENKVYPQFSLLGKLTDGGESATPVPHDSSTLVRFPGKIDPWRIVETTVGRQTVIN